MAEKSRNLRGCRPKTAPSDTEDQPKDQSWPKEDRIRWVEWRLRELTIKAGEYVDERGKWLLEERAAGGQRLKWGDEIADYAVWLLKYRDGLSWHQIAYRFFPTATEDVIEKYELRVRRAYDRVERNHPGSKHFKAAPLSEHDKLLLRAVALGAIPVPVGTAPETCPGELRQSEPESDSLGQESAKPPSKS